MSDTPKQIIRLGRRAGKLAILAAATAALAASPAPTAQLHPVTGETVLPAPATPDGTTTTATRSVGAEQQVLAQQARKLLRRQYHGRGKVRGAWLARKRGGRLGYFYQRYPKSFGR